MSRRVVFTRGLVLLLLSGVVAGCSAGSQLLGLRGPGTTGELAPHVAGEVLVRFHPGADTAGTLAAVGGVVKTRIPRIDVWVVRLPADRSVAETVKTLQARQGVRYAEPNYLIFVPEDGRPTPIPSGRLPPLTSTQQVVPPNDDAYPEKLWGLVKIGAETAWSATTGDATAVIAILDTGVDSTHPDLSGKVLASADCTSGTCISGIPTDGNGHGTHVAGTAVALGNNSIGVVGVAFGLTQILSVKVLGAGGSGQTDWAAAGIIWAADQINLLGKKGPINLSVGGPGYSQLLQDAVAYALGSGSVLVVAAMGNEYKRWGTTYPAALPGAMAVGATDGTDAKARFSNTGPHISVTAPGVDIYSTLPAVLGPSYGYFSGTSMATPHVSGLAALVWSLNPGFTNYQVRRKIEESAFSLGGAGWDEIYGWGRINAASAVTTDTPSAYYGCAQIEVVNASLTPEPNADVIMTASTTQGVVRRTARTDSAGTVWFDWLPAATYTATASKVMIDGSGHYGTATVNVIAIITPTCVGPTTITLN